MQVLELIAENFKRLKLARVKPTGPVTSIVGKNAAGKTSVLDAFTAALGGANSSPEMPIRKGADSAEVIVDLGDIIVTRKWTTDGKSTLTVATKEGAKYPSPQAMLDKLIGKLSFDPLAFERMKPQEQAATFAKLVGIDLDGYTAKRRQAFDERTHANRTHKELEARLKAMPTVETVEPVSMSDLIAELQKARTINAEADKAQQLVTTHNAKVKDIAARIDRQTNEVERIRKMLHDADNELKQLQQLESDIKADALTIVRAANEAPRIDVSAIEDRIRDADAVNARAKAFKDRQMLAEQVESSGKNCDTLTAKIEKIDAEHQAAIAATSLPVPGLAFTADGVTLNGIPFEQCSGAEKLRTSVAVGLALNPKLKLMLIRDGSLLDENGMALLAEMAEKANAQILVERVDNGKEVGIHIVDGETVEPSIG